MGLADRTRRETRSGASICSVALYQIGRIEQTIARLDRLETVLLVPLRLAERRLGRRQPGDRHAEGRAAHVVHADLVAEMHAVGVAAVLAADADLQVLVVLRLPRLAPLLDADVDELADAAD